MNHKQRDRLLRKFLKERAKMEKQLERDRQLYEQMQQGQQSDLERLEMETSNAIVRVFYWSIGTVLVAFILTIGFLFYKGYLPLPW